MSAELILRPLFDWRSAVASPMGPAKPTTRHVLLTLSLHMSVKGDSCFPSIDRLTEETGLSRRAVIEHLQLAEKDGWIAKRDMSQRSGQGWRRIEYFARIPDDLEAVDNLVGKKGGAPGSPRQGGDFDAEGGAPNRKKVVHQDHPSTSVNTTESTSGRIDTFQLPDWVKPATWEAYVETRKKAKKVMTSFARDLIIAELLKLKKAGQDPDEVLKQSIRNAWTDVYALGRDKLAATGSPGAARWWDDDKAMEAMAKQHGVSTLGKTRYQLKAAIEEKIGQGRTH